MFRFTIRDVLWLTVVVAMGCAWGVEHQSVARMKRELRVQTAVREFALAQANRQRADTELKTAYAAVYRESQAFKDKQAIEGKSSAPAEPSP
jgi:hypothetical protein